MQTPAVERALAAKIDRDGAVQRTTEILERDGPVQHDIVGLGDDEVRAHIGQRVSVLLTKDNLWPTDENPEGRIMYSGLLRSFDLVSARLARYEVVADDGTHYVIENSRQIERIDDIVG
jgi:hypothetical protein